MVSSIATVNGTSIAFCSCGVWCTFSTFSTNATIWGVSPFRCLYLQWPGFTRVSNAMLLCGLDAGCYFHSVT